MLKLNHKNLEFWKRGIELISQIYSITENFAKKEMIGLSNQMRRASISIASNIAEGASRKSCLERKRFYEIARSSAVELDTQLEIALMLKYISKTELDKIEEDFIQIFKMLSGLLKATINEIH